MFITGNNFMNAKTLLFFAVSFYWLLANALISLNILPGILLLAARELWVIIFILMVFVGAKSKVYQSYIWLTVFWLIISSVLNYSSLNILVAYYGFRDLILLLFIVYALNNPFKINAAVGFVKVVFLLSFLQVMLSFVRSEEFVLNFFRINEYYELKNIETNVNGGINGVRLLFPFYSTGLLGTFFSFVIISAVMKNRRIIALFLGVFTMSKTVIVIPMLDYLRKFRFGLLVFILSVFIFLPVLIAYILESIDTGLLTFHAASVRDRFNVLPLLWSELKEMRINQLGSNSVAGFILQDKDASYAPESMIVARIMDYGVAAPILLFQLIMLYKICNKNNRSKFLMIITLFMFTSLSNHPIAFIPFLIEANCE